jgi:hypothetical protein
MRKLGVILSAYGIEEYVKPCLNSWIKFDIPIACSSFQFENFEKQSNAACVNELKKLLPEECIFYDENKSFKEHEARNISLDYLKNNTDIDTVLILDVDEFYTEKEIENLLKFINSEDFSWIAWAKINFKNYVFDGKSWTDDFCPPRIFKIKYQDYALDKFYWDNDILYIDKNSASVDYKQLSSITVPKNKIHVKHMTWLDNERSKNKIKYQEKHFGSCSYQWNDSKKCVEINKDFYKKSGQIPPTIYNDIYA